jgi:hypothetical protein
MEAVTLVLISGVCRVCRCTRDHACMVPLGDGRDVPCWWVNSSMTLCSNPACLAAIPLDELIYEGLKGMASVERAKEAALKL